jgi:hypothetical protein
VADAERVQTGADPLSPHAASGAVAAAGVALVIILLALVRRARRRARAPPLPPTAAPGFLDRLWHSTVGLARSSVAVNTL